MRTRRLIVSAVILMAAAAGCSTSGGGSATASPAPRPPATIPSDPAQALTAAHAQLGRENLRFAYDAGGGPLGFAGVVNAQTGNWEITGKEYVVRRVGTDVYIRASGRTLASLMVPAPTADHLAAGGWVRTRLPNGHELMTVWNDDFPWNLAESASRGTGMHRTGSRSFSGTASLTNGKKVPLSVDLDGQGRFTKIRIGKDIMVFTFSDFGVPAGITAPPPGEVVVEDNPSFTASLGLV
ncbi:hypothetical protein [Actinoplanes sp. NPDC049681]|uniref:hypothetical protein n=1 Tax=Actinoplanes sp. NPDC049681 TaxID=3363905 RepID=UPI0037B9FBDD